MVEENSKAPLPGAIPSQQPENGRLEDGAPGKVSHFFGVSHFKVIKHQINTIL
jgi:hypothetical protein